jgi:thiol:disulfide interchange protein
MSYQPSSRSTTSSLAIVSLVFGILSWCVLPFIGAIVAVVCGHLARSEIRRSADGPMEGDGMAVAGLVLGYLHLLLCVLLIVIGIAALFFGLAFTHWHWH